MSTVNKASLPFEVYDLDDSLTKLKMLIYGDNVVGKTVLAGSAGAVADMSPVLMVDIKGNSTSLLSFDFKDNITLTKLEHFSGKEQSFEQITDYILANAGQFKTLVIDKLTGLQELLVEQETAAQGKKAADLQVWLKVAGKFKNELRKIRDLPLHVIATADERIFKCESTGKETRLPGISGKVAKEVIGYFDIVGRMGKVIDQEKKVRRVIHFEGNDGFVARDDTMSLRCEKGPYVADPTMEILYGLVKAKHNI